MLRPLITACLLSLPISAPAQTASPFAKCHGTGLEAAYRDWKSDPKEADLIKTTNGRVVRMRNVLSIRTDNNFKATFVNNLPDQQPCDFMPDTLSYPETYRFEGMIGQTALVGFSGYEFLATVLIDTVNGRQYRVDGLDGPLPSPGERFLVFPGSFASGEAWLEIFDTTGPLRMARVTSKMEVESGSMRWEAPDRLALSVRWSRNVPFRTAQIDIDDIGINLTLDPGGTIEVPFAPIDRDAPLPFGP